MHILSRGDSGELAVFQGPTCSNIGLQTRCQCAQLIGIESRQPVEVATVVDRDLTPADLEAACLKYLQRTGWYQLAPEQARELVEAMAFDIVDIASEFQVGTRLHAHYQHISDQWVFYEVPEPADAIASG